ncbi:hypothetical protein J2W27_004335 [Variovorax boronicumulans]|uniref:YgaP family membrane protein n=1 Tax=Variovorax boronicumulans TaxID=436515 RepID=UPI00278A8951|nr:DUF2892 domain-containing protein [Variovorax boronicumulans]MDP9912211.1 hypothetical protein [Variovorax boronicumulans]
MLYVKNLPGWERALRIALGLIGLAFAALNWPANALAVAVGLMGAMLALTGLVGFCPMCAMVGRTLDKGR